MKAVFLRTPYNYDTDDVSRETGLDCDLENEPSLTQQQFREETDINTIVERFGVTGQIPGTYHEPVSGDFTDVTTFEDAMNRVTEAQQNFLQLPAQLRERFNNNPQRLLDFLSDDENKPEALKLGLINKPPEKTRDMIAAIDDLHKTLSTPKTP
ncbi:MAG: internal scaffolding protein [Arizlama microvirus]|nr:MAG: internal scaffolding protein [Arizlama microvirus]